MKISQHAKGRWPEIITALLGEQYADTRKHQPCPRGEGTDRYRFSDVGGHGNYFCACSDGGKDGFELLQCVNGWDFKQAAKAVESVIGPCDSDPPEPQPETWASKLRREVIKTPRSAYLEGRGLEVPEILDWHKSLPYFDDGGKLVSKRPAMLAPIYRGGKFITYHVTYLEAGGKAKVDKVRKILPAHGSIKGAGCPLYQPRDGLIGVAEGIETAIAAKILFDTPVHAALNTALLKSWEPPDGVEGVIVYADNDNGFGGQAAAYTLAHRLHGKGYDVTVAIPPEPGKDWNDILLEKQ